MGRAYQTATRKGGRHSVHYNNYDLRTVKTKTRLSIEYVGRYLFIGTPTHWCCLA